jgi:cystathionine beta-lyase/cystathionine gamma-synthase
MAAIAAVLDLLDANSHIIAADDLYGGAYQIFERIRRRTSGLEVSYVDLANPENLVAAIKPNTRMVWIETPTNPLLKLVDIAAVTQLAKARGLLSIVDYTFASPWIHRPLDLGADIVLHSTTKFINGHSDIIGGAVVVKDSGIAEKLKFIHDWVGGIASPFDAFLAHRGLKTLALRMQRHCESSLELARWLEKHPKVVQVYYPGLPSHPQHELAKRQMKNGFGGIISFVLRGDLAQATAFLKTTRLFVLAKSLGGVESLSNHPAIMTHAGIPADIRQKLGIVDSLIRLSVGIENLHDLQADLVQALTVG